MYMCSCICVCACICVCVRAHARILSVLHRISFGPLIPIQHLKNETTAKQEKNYIQFFFFKMQ